MLHRRLHGLALPGLSALALRLNAIRRQERTFQDASTFNLEGQTLAATGQSLRHTLVRLEYERGNFENARGFAGVSIREQSARSRAFTSSGTYFSSDGEWIQRATLPSADRSNGPAGLEFSYNHQNQMALRTDNYFNSTISLDVNGRPYIDTTLDMKRFGNEWRQNYAASFLASGAARRKAGSARLLARQLPARHHQRHRNGRRHQPPGAGLRHARPEDLESDGP
ncbi:MAG: hypothetical protein FJ399_22100, partial [Verrucomicrobia bacterium]|nr:hypothetical protein [Verrucomicrobiota bacterium]